MIEFGGSIILLDIEGTVSPLAYVHEVMFPFAREQMAFFLREHLNKPQTVHVLQQMALDAGFASLGDWCPFPLEQQETARGWIMAEVYRLMAEDAKVTGLKQLQGLIWEQGFHAGALRASLFEDVAESMRDWCEQGRGVRIYSSGSVHAQQLFFQHTTAGDLTALISGWYDTTVGSKRDPSSYATIARHTGQAAGSILFVSDVVEELDAARAANLQTALAIRPGNRETEDAQHPRIHSLRDIHFT